MVPEFLYFAEIFTELDICTKITFHTNLCVDLQNILLLYL